MATHRFQATVIRSDDRTYIAIPFDPDEVWGVKERHYVKGSIGEHSIRGCLDHYGTQLVLPLGAAWLRDNDLGDDDTVEVALEPDGHQIDSIAPDIAVAIAADPEARAFFEGVAPFYRNNTIRWIEDAKRPETRAKRITEAVSQLKAGKKR